MQTAFIIFATLAAAALAYPQSTASTSDQAFLKEAAQGNTAEIEMGTLAEKDASNAAVKQFGERMVTDHSKLGEEARKVATKTSIVLPSGPGSMDHAEYTRLAAKTGTDFDKAYITEMIKDHQHDIAAFEKEANSGSNADIKSFASQALPTLREHLRMAESAAKQIGISPTGM
jgi:putative membrane protein